jgi:CheY-like chemotaxis protein
MEKKGLNVLIVEDEQLIAILISDILGDFGYHITGITDNGKDAIRIAEELKPDIILMDIVLRGEMSGIEAADIIGKKADIPVVYLTAQSDRDTVERALKSHPFGFMIKPFTPMELYATMQAAYSKHQFYQAEREVLRRDVILEAVNSAAANFLKSGDVRDYIRETMQSLGEAAGVNRLVVFENAPDAENTGDRARVLLQWRKHDEIPYLFNDNPIVSFSSAGTGTWKTELARGRIVAVECDTGGGEDRAFFHIVPDEDFLIVPVFSGEDWWGSILFEGQKREGFWSAPEIDAFGAAASIIGSAMYREYTHDALVAYITEGAMRLNHPLEMVIYNLKEIQQELEEGVPPGLIKNNIGVQLVNLEAILTSLKELTREILEKQKNIPDKYREFLSR